MASQLGLDFRNNDFTVLDLFSGAGGMALGFEAAGARGIAAVEIDHAAAATFGNMFPDTIVLGGPERGDLSRWEPANLLDEVGRPDLVVGGPPCQGFSRIGRAKLRSLDAEAHARKAGYTERNDLYQVFRDVVREAEPLAFVMENVPAMRELGGVDVAYRVARELATCGYNVRYFLLNSAWYGVPQQRWRLFFVGFKSELGMRAVPEAPVRTHVCQPDLPEGVTIPDDPWMVWGGDIPTDPEARAALGCWEALQDLPRRTGHLDGESPSECSLPLQHEPMPWVQRHMRNWPGRPATGPVGGNWYRSTPRDYPIFREMAHGDRYPEALSIAHRLYHSRLGALRESGKAPRPGTKALEQLRASMLPPYRNDAFDDKWRKLIPDQPAWTVTAHLARDGYSHIHYSSAQARTLTVREAARLQSFPDSFEFSGNFGDAFRQIGNAVPPLLARAVAEQVLTQLASLLESDRAVA